MTHTDNRLPLYDLPLRGEGANQEVWDSLRKKWLVLTPEEYVRQCLVRFLIEEKGVPTGLISIERGLVYNSLQKRYDVVIYNRKGTPMLATECKRPTVELSQDTVMQLVTYNSKLGAPYLLMTNGKNLLFFAEGEDEVFRFRETIPTFEQMLAGE